MEEVKIVLERVDADSERSRLAAAVEEMELFGDLKLIAVENLPNSPENVRPGNEEIEELELATQIMHGAGDGDAGTRIGKSTVNISSAAANQLDIDDDQEDGSSRNSQEEVSGLKNRVEELEKEIENLHAEVRLLRRKMRNFDPQGLDFQKLMESKILSILDDQNWRISRMTSNNRLDGVRLHSPRIVIQKSSNQAVRHRHHLPKQSVVPRPHPLSRPRTKIKKRGFSAPLTSDDETDIEKKHDGDPLASVEKIDEDEHSDPSYFPGGAESNLENVQPKIRIHSPKVVPSSGKQVGKSSQGKIVIVKKYDTFSETPKKPDSVVRAGDVSVILDDDEQEHYFDEPVGVPQRTQQMQVPQTHHPRSNRVSKPYVRPKVKCSMCPRECRSQHDLTRHERMHTGEKPYSCSVCGETTRFSQSYHLARHMRSYHMTS